MEEERVIHSPSPSKYSKNTLFYLESHLYLLANGLSPLPSKTRKKKENIDSSHSEMSEMLQTKNETRTTLPFLFVWWKNSLGDRFFYSERLKNYNVLLVAIFGELQSKIPAHITHSMCATGSTSARPVIMLGGVNKIEMELDDTITPLIFEDIEPIANTRKILTQSYHLIKSLSIMLQYFQI